MSFPLLHKFLDGSDLIVFLDFEGTQFSHKVISIGMVACKKEKDSLLFDAENPMKYQRYILSDDPLGPIVEEMTKINSELLHEKGIPLHQAILEINKMLRPYKKKFICYGNLDMKMMHLTIDEKNQTESDFFKNMVKNHLDFHSYLEKRITNEKGQSYSIEKLLSLFSLSSDGPFHDPLTDALDLMKIFQAYVMDEEKTIDMVLKNYRNNPYTSKIDKKLATQLIEKGDVNLSSLREILKEHL